jgi:phosphoglycerate kinase
MKKTIKDIDLKGKRVLIRVDFNVPIKDGVITSNKRILAALPTINYAIQAGAKVILLSHLGRVKTEQDKKTKSLKIVAEELGKELRQKVTFIPETRGKLLENTIKDMMPKEVLMMENTRFEDLNNSAESKNSPELGKY